MISAGCVPKGSGEGSHGHEIDHYTVTNETVAETVLYNKYQYICAKDKCNRCGKAGGCKNGAMKLELSWIGLILGLGFFLI